MQASPARYEYGGDAVIEPDAQRSPFLDGATRLFPRGKCRSDLDALAEQFPARVCGDHHADHRPHAAPAARPRPQLGEITTMSDTPAERTSQLAQPTRRPIVHRPPERRGEVLPDMPAPHAGPPPLSRDAEQLDQGEPVDVPPAPDDAGHIVQPATASQGTEQQAGEVN
jgi:hypothetical protein